MVGVGGIFRVGVRVGVIVGIFRVGVRVGVIVGIDVGTDVGTTVTVGSGVAGSSGSVTPLIKNQTVALA